MLNSHDKILEVFNVIDSWYFSLSYVNNQFVYLLVFFFFNLITNENLLVIFPSSLSFLTCQHASNQGS
jgi:hypothetical protein